MADEHYGKFFDVTTGSNPPFGAKLKIVRNTSKLGRFIRLQRFAYTLVITNTI